jgi:hypothetical protein
MKTSWQRKQVWMIGSVLLSAIASLTFWLWLPDQRFVGVWAVHSAGMDGSWKVRYDWDGSGVYRDPAKGVWLPLRWHAKFGHVRPPRDRAYSPSARDVLTSWYDRIVLGKHSGYEVLSAAKEQIRMTNLSTGQLVVLQRVSDTPADASKDDF